MLLMSAKLVASAAGPDFGTAGSLYAASAPFLQHTRYTLTRLARCAPVGGWGTAAAGGPPGHPNGPMEGAGVFWVGQVEEEHVVHWVPAAGHDLDHLLRHDPPCGASKMLSSKHATAAGSPPPRPPAPRPPSDPILSYP